jgi:hypothetical protein
MLEESISNMKLGGLAPQASPVKVDVEVQESSKIVTDEKVEDLPEI